MATFFSYETPCNNKYALNLNMTNSYENIKEVYEEIITIATWYENSTYTKNFYLKPEHFSKDSF